MTTFKEGRRQCQDSRTEPLGKDGDGFDLCCVSSGYICCDEACVSTNEHKQPGWYKNRAIEMTNLVDGFRKEIVRDEPYVEETDEGEAD